MRGKAVVAPVRLRHRQRDSVPGLHVQSLRQRLHQASPAPEGVRADRHRRRRRWPRRKLRLVLQDYEPDPIPVHLGQAILPLKLRRFTEFATSRLRKSLAADWPTSAPKTSAEKKK